MQAPVSRYLQKDEQKPVGTEPQPFQNQAQPGTSGQRPSSGLLQVLRKDPRPTAANQKPSCSPRKKVKTLTCHSTLITMLMPHPGLHLQQHHGKQAPAASLASIVSSVRVQAPGRPAQQPVITKRSREDSITQPTAPGANRTKQPRYQQSSASTGSGCVVSLGSKPAGTKQKATHMVAANQFNFYEDGAGSWDHDSLGIEGVRQVSLPSDCSPVPLRLPVQSSLLRVCHVRMPWRPSLDTTLAIQASLPLLVKCAGFVP
jgi:hypothetical protein